MSCYRICPYCGCNLDPGERCDCRGLESKGNSAKKDASQPAKHEKRPACETAGAVYASNYRRQTAIGQVNNWRYCK